MSYILKLHGKYKFVAPPGRKHSYTNRKNLAKQYPTLEAAKGDACGNESPIPYP